MRAIIDFGQFVASSPFNIVKHKVLHDDRVPNGGALAILEIKDVPRGKPSGFVSCYYHWWDHDSFLVAAWQTLEHATRAFESDLGALCLRPEELPGFLGKEEFTREEYPWFFSKITYKVEA